MDAEQQRLYDLAAGWEDSDAEVTVSGRDAAVLEEAGAKLTPVKGKGGVFTITGKDLFAAAEKLKKSAEKKSPRGEPVPLSEMTQTPNQASIGGPTEAKAKASEAAHEDDGEGDGGTESADTKHAKGKGKHAK
jgi:hypothetical protein